MAETGYGCEFGDCRMTPVHLHTDTRNGACVSLCEEHNAPGLIPLLAAELGVDPGHFYAAVEKFLKAESRKAEKDVANAQAAQAAESSGAPASSPDEDLADDANDRRSDEDKSMDGTEREVMFP